jgi:hypothetical protein
MKHSPRKDISAPTHVRLLTKDLKRLIEMRKYKMIQRILKKTMGMLNIVVHR